MVASSSSTTLQIYNTHPMPPRAPTTMRMGSMIGDEAAGDGETAKARSRLLLAIVSDQGSYSGVGA